MTQKDKIKNHLLRGKTLTPFQAFEKYNCTRLAAVVSNLKNEGVKIKTIPVVKNGARFASYKAA